MLYFFKRIYKEILYLYIVSKLYIVYFLLIRTRYYDYTFYTLKNLYFNFVFLHRQFTPIYFIRICLFYYYLFLGFLMTTHFFLNKYNLFIIKSSKQYNL